MDPTISHVLFSVPSSALDKLPVRATSLSFIKHKNDKNLRNKIMYISVNKLNAYNKLVRLIEL